ncbi:S41 family peptidase [Gammaproteobacteria bacterium]|nr:S41 family peptidase [Gammaproteobacteria bacterium]
MNTRLFVSRLLGRFPICVFAAAFLLLGANYSAAADPESLTSLDTAFYRVQSFDTKAGAKPLAINHLGIETKQAADGGYLITAALEGYPAHAAGLERGDIVLRIDGADFHPLLSLNSHAAESQFRPHSAPAELTYRRGATVLTARVEPVFESLYDSYRSATLNSVLSFAAGNKVIGYVRLWALTRETGDLVTLSQLLQSLHDTDGIVLDLRNSYGYLALEHIDLFRASRSDFLSISLVGKPNSNAIEHERNRLLPARQRDDTLRAYRKPIAILIDSSTRGAAELLAYQLAKLDRVTTVGEPTLGRLGSYQRDGGVETLVENSVENLENNLNKSLDGGSLDYSAADRVLIDGNVFEGIGVKPKRNAPFPFETVSRGDPQFQVAVNVLMGVI